MGRLQRIEDVVNATVSHYSHVKIFPRGLPFFIDSLLRGTIRFGRRTGNNIAVINPDNTFRLGKEAQARDSQILLSTPTEWLTIGAILSMGPGKEIQQVQDIVDSTVILSAQLSQDYTTSDTVLLHSYPILVDSNAHFGDTVIRVRSHYFLANGDTFVYPQTFGLLQSLTEIKILEARFDGTSSDAFNTQIYTLTLAKPLGRDLDLDSEVYIRAYPAYSSAPVRVPNSVSSAEPIGPFLLDILSGRLIEGNNFTETLAVKTINRSGDYVLGTAQQFVTVDKNTVILDRPWSAHYPMFWSLAEGTMRITSNKLVMRVNNSDVDSERLFFNVGLKCVPNLPTNKTWRLNLRANDDCSIRFYFRPYPPTEVQLFSGVTQTVILSIPNGIDPVTDLEINILANSNVCEVQMSDWTPVGNTVEQVVYSLVVEAVGIATYQSTGMLIKPFFMSSDFLQTTYDLGATYDGGKIYF